MSRAAFAHRLAAAEADPVATMLRARVPHIASETELRQIWRAWRHATLAAMLRGRTDAPAPGQADETA